MKRLFVFTLMLLMLGMTSPAFAQSGDRLRLGDAAPGLDVKDWALGGEEFAMERGTSYGMLFIDFQAISSIDEFYRDLRLFEELGTMMEEIAIRTDNFEVIVVYSGLGDLEIRTGVDRYFRSKIHLGTDNDRATYSAWIEKANIQGNMLTAFLVDTHGAVQWMGNPWSRRNLFAQITSLVAADRFDYRLWQQSRPVLETIDNHRRVKNYKFAHAAYDKLLEADKRIFAYHNYERYKMALLEEGDIDGAGKLLEDMINNYTDDPDFLSYMQSKLLTDPEIPDSMRDVDGAMQIAEMLTELYPDDDPRQHHYRALAFYHRKDFDKAVELQRKAYFLAGERTKSTHRQYLDEFQSAVKDDDKKGTGRDRFRRDRFK